MKNIKSLANELIDLIGDKTATFQIQLNQIPFLMMCLMSFMCDGSLTDDQREVASTHYADLRAVLTNNVPDALLIIEEIERFFGMTVIAVLKEENSNENSRT